MKNYVKPTINLIDLRPEEQIGKPGPGGCVTNATPKITALSTDLSSKPPRCKAFSK